MIYSIISENDIFYTPVLQEDYVRSSNPYDYIRPGYFLDNASLFGGKDNVDYNCNFSGYRTGSHLDSSGV